MLYEIAHALGLVLLLVTPASFLLSAAEPVNGAPMAYQIVQRWFLGLASFLSVLQNSLLVASDGLLHYAQSSGWVTQDEARDTGLTLPERHRRQSTQRRNMMGTISRFAEFATQEFLGRGVEGNASASDANILGTVASLGSLLVPRPQTRAQSSSDRAAETSRQDAWYTEPGAAAADTSRSPSLLEVPTILPRRRRNRTPPTQVAPTTVQKSESHRDATNATSKNDNDNDGNVNATETIQSLDHLRFY